MVNEYCKASIAMVTVLILASCGGVGSSSSESSSSSSSSASSSGGGASFVIQENDTSFCLRPNVVIENEHPGFTGVGYANTDNVQGATLSWKVSVSVNQNVTVQIRYAHGAATTRFATLNVNGGGSSVSNVTFSGSSDWTNWQVVNIPVNLYDGENTLELISESTEGLANIDSIGFIGGNVAAAECEENWTASVPFNMSGQDGIHDPSTLVKDGDRYWTFGTGVGSERPINALYSDDLMTWHQGASPIPPNTYPSWINSKLPIFDGNFWAPDIIQMNDRYYLYYSAFSSTVLNSAIGVMVSDSLNNPSWRDLGMVVSTQDEPRSIGNQPINTIDAGLYRDAGGQVWMVYGSHYGGIFIRQINPQTGLLLNNTRYNAAGNRGGWNEYEAAQVQYINGTYYLFVNLGDCCAQLSSDYLVYVGRANSPTGPFITQSGHNLWDGDVISQQQVDDGVTAGSVLSSQPGYVGPGHFGYLYNKGQHLASIHYYGGNDGWGHLRILEINFVNDWPLFNYNFNLRQ